MNFRPSFTVNGELEEIFFDTILSLIDGSTLFVSDSSGELIALDITDPRAPTYVGHFSTGSDINEMIIEGDLLIGGTGDFRRIHFQCYRSHGNHPAGQFQQFLD